MTVLELPSPPLRRVTPTAHLLLPATAPREAWLKARRGGLGSSDIAAVMGVSTYRTPLHVYYEKRGELPLDDDAGEAALWGTLNEATVADEWARRNKSAIRRVGLVSQVGAPWRMCTLDRRVTVCPLNRSNQETCALEVKTRSAFLVGKWRRGTPDDVLAQGLWQSRVTGYDHLHVACLFGGNDYRQYTVRASAHGQLIEDITTVADRLWHENITAGNPPPGEGDPNALIDLYDQLNPDRGGVVRLDRHPDAYDALGDYLDAAAEETAAKKRKDVAKASLVAALGGAEIGVLDDQPAFTYTEQSRAYTDTALLAERWPDAYDACVRDRRSRRLNITNSFRAQWGQSL
jgi:putative phage-type endonuclease